ncbi:tRNA pseudouridine(38-40) synthase TruA [Candidatus Margulisiibacteriota bacterium]
MRNLKLIIEYDGGHFSGFQVQPKGKTVQGEIEKAIFKLTGEKVRITGSGRTDSGVHALYQVVNFKTRSKLDPRDIKRALNSLLSNIVIKDIEKASMSFDARRKAKKREYVYLVYSGATLPVFLIGRVCHVKGKLDLGRIRKISKILLGKHDFSSFCVKDKSEKSCLRELKRIEIGRRSIDLLGDRHRVIYLRFVANGFLWKMIRFIVGTMLKVGQGRMSAAEVKRILASKDNRNAGPVAPAQGLYLTRVWY